MTEVSQQQANSGSSGALNREQSFVAHMQTRTIGPGQEFFAKRLKPGMRLLDCGCGPGTLTLGFASLVEPGEVIGIDIDPRMVEMARAAAAEARADNIRFEAADVYKLPFPNASFEAVWAQSLLLHVPDPLGALKEMRRVVQVGGLAGIVDQELSVAYMTPETPLLREAAELTQRIRDLMGGSPFYAREQRRLLLTAGFDRAEQMVFPMAAGTAEDLGRERPFVEARLRGYMTTAASHGWIDEKHADEITNDMQEWFQRPDSFLFQVAMCATGFVDS